MDSGDFMHQLKNPNLYSKTNLTEEKRVEMGKKLFGSYGTRIDKGEIEKVKKELNMGKWGKFKDLSQEEKRDAEGLIRGLERFRE